MKHAILATLVAFTGLAPAMDFHAPGSVSQRLMQIDLDVATRHYEKLQGLLRDTKLEQLAGESGGGDASHAEQVKLARKIEVITQLSEETRMEILKLGQALEESGAKMESAYRPVRPSTPAATAGNNYLPSVDPAATVPSVAGIPGATAPPPVLAAPPRVEATRPIEPVPAAPPVGVPGLPGAAPAPVPPAPPSAIQTR
jgi:hypothetical protein